MNPKASAIASRALPASPRLTEFARASASALWALIAESRSDSRSPAPPRAASYEHINVAGRLSGSATFPANAAVRRRASPRSEGRFPRRRVEIDPPGWHAPQRLAVVELRANRGRQSIAPWLVMPRVSGASRRPFLGLSDRSPAPAFRILARAVRCQARLKTA